jgi:hypothetical protein
VPVVDVVKQQRCAIVRGRWWRRCTLAVSAALELGFPQYGVLTLSERCALTRCSSAPPPLLARHLEATMPGHCFHL